MKVLLQRVNSASVKVSGEIIGEIARGLLLLVGFSKQDSASQLKPMAEKLAHMRIFPDDRGRFHLSLLDINGEALIIPQFTLYADTSKGRRPDFFSAMDPQPAEELFHEFMKCFKELELARVSGGQFGANMKVCLENDGPVTILVEG